ncbi:hypothetical protein BC826DRAFT_1054875 [Russula brevipes]|nr:hypothetical protein BC826DRAFT_1054875 [Russula brevipes]
MRRNIGRTTHSSGRYRPTYGKGWKISSTRTNHFFRRGSTHPLFTMPPCAGFMTSRNTSSSSTDKM